MQELAKLIIFDADGVLVDACDIHFRAFQQALREQGIELSYAEHQARLNARPTRDKLRILAAEHGLTEATQAVIAQRKQSLTLELFATELRYDLSKVELLSSLHRAGWLIGVASNSLRASLRVMLERTGVLHLCDMWAGNEDAAPKPAPDLYLLVANTLGVPMDRVVIVEDSPVGLEAARRAHPAAVIAVSNPSEVTLALLEKIQGALPHD